jgi:hypothetical protein
MFWLRIHMHYRVVERKPTTLSLSLKTGLGSLDHQLAIGDGSSPDSVVPPDSSRDLILLKPENLASLIDVKIKLRHAASIAEPSW